jgi:predicted molibdopterin-dependent oxidoreductase YjgC
LLIEADPLDSHPIIGYRVREAVRKGAELIVAHSEQVGLAIWLITTCRLKQAAP